MLAVALLLPAFASCDDQAEPTPLDATNPALVDATFNTLVMKWDKVPGAVQYSYTLTTADAPDRVITRNVTTGTRATLTDLEPSTDYVLTVLSYAAIGSKNTTSEPIVLKARTADLQPLAAPAPVWSRDVNTILVDWDAVAGASSYKYALTDAGGVEIAAGNTVYNYLDFPTMTTGVYTLTLQALTSTPGLAASPVAQLSIDFVREHLQMWTVEATYNSGLTGKSWPVTLIAYDDNSYSIKAWYGVEGYDLDFAIDPNNAADQFSLTGAYIADGKGNYAVPTGLTGAEPSAITVTPGNNRCAMTGAAGKGSVTLAVSLGGVEATDEVTWGITIEDFLGTWNFAFEYVDYYDETGSEERTVEVTLGSEPNSIMLPLPKYYSASGSGMAVIDFSNMTFTMAPAATGVWTYAGEASETDPMTGTVSLRSITINNLEIWRLYDGVNYDNFETYKYSLTR